MDMKQVEIPLKQFVVKRFDVNPFCASLKDALVLCDAETQEPIHDIEFGSKLVKEGDILMEGSFTIKWCSTNPKHLVPGDVVQTKDCMFDGTIVSIDWNEHYTYESIIKVKDFRLSRQGEMFQEAAPSPGTEKTFTLRDVVPLGRYSATIPCPCCGR